MILCGVCTGCYRGPHDSEWGCGGAEPDDFCVHVTE